MPAKKIEGENVVSGAKTPAQAAADAGLTWHFMVRAINRTAATTPNPISIGGGDLDRIVTEWQAAGWKVDDVQVIEANETAYNVMVIFVR